MVLVGMAAGGVREMRWVPGWRECRVLCKFIKVSQCKRERGKVPSQLRPKDEQKCWASPESWYEEGREGWSSVRNCCATAER